MSSSKIIRKFELMFPGIAADEYKYNQDLEAGGKDVAERNARIRRSMNSVKDTTNEEGYEVLGDFENQTGTFTPTTKEENE